MRYGLRISLTAALTLALGAGGFFGYEAYEGREYARTHTCEQVRGSLFSSLLPAYEWALHHYARGRCTDLKYASNPMPETKQSAPQTAAYATKNVSG